MHELLFKYKGIVIAIMPLKGATVEQIKFCCHLVADLHGLKVCDIKMIFHDDKEVANA